MSPFPILLAQAAVSSGGVTKILDDFGIRGPFLLAQIINFAIVAFLLWKFAFKPILATIDKRQHEIDAGLKYAEASEAKLRAAQQASVAQIREAQVKGQQLIAEARKAAKEFHDKQQKEALEKANALIQRAQEAIELEKRKMLADVRVEIARLVVSTTQRVLSRELSEAERARYNETAARELAKV
jgi:F-type H+-transporting ATPase subunit b